MPDRINVTRSSMPPFEEYMQEIRPLWDSRWLTNMGEKHDQLQQQLQQVLGVAQVSLFANGHSALEMTLQALGLPHGGQVITTPFTFASTVHAIVRSGLEPVFCDIRPGDCTLDPACIEPLVGPATCAILPVHVYGNLCDTEAIAAIAERHGLKVVYDAAHAFGVTKGGVGAGSFGDASMFSFHATKVFHTVEGGAVASSDPALHQTLYSLRDFGIADAEHVEAVGGNAKMSEFHAAMGLCNLRRLPQYIASRREVCQRYLQRLAGAPGVRVLLQSAPDVQPNYAYMPVYFDPAVIPEGREGVQRRLAAQGIGARKYFYPLASDYGCYRAQYDSSRTPVARRAAAGVLTLPLYEGLALADVDRICDIILQK